MHLLFVILLVLVDLILSTALVFNGYVFLWYITSLQDRRAFSHLYDDQLIKNEELQRHILELNDRVISSEQSVRFFQQEIERFRAHPNAFKQGIRS